MFIFQNLKLDDYPLSDVVPATDSERWLIDRIVKNLTAVLTAAVLREEIYAIAMGWESSGLYIEGSYNTESAWERKKGEISREPYWESRWHCHLWTSLEDTFFIFGGNDDEADAAWNWSQDGRDEIPWRIRYWGLTVTAIRQFRAQEAMRLFRRDLPVICHYPIDSDLGWQATRSANPEGQADEYLRILDAGPAA